MKIFIAVLLLLVALFLVIKGGDIFVDSSQDIAKRLKIPSLVFGATIASIATTLPELLIAIFSSLDGTTDLAVGNAVGSLLCNYGLILGICFAYKGCDLSRGGMLKYYLSLVVAFVIFGFGLFFEITNVMAYVLLALTVLYFVVNYIDAVTTDKKSQKKSVQEKKQKPLWLTILLFILGAGAIGGGAYLLVDKVEFLAKVVGISEEFVGLTIVAVGTSLPELVIVLNAIKGDSPYLAIGNIIGSSILNVTLILGVSKLVAFNSKMIITKETAYISLALSLLFSILLLLPILITKKTYRWQGFVFLGLYIMYIVYLVLNVIFKFI